MVNRYMVTLGYLIIVQYGKSVQGEFFLGVIHKLRGQKIGIFYLPPSPLWSNVVIRLTPLRNYVVISQPPSPNHLPKMPIFKSNFYRIFCISKLFSF